ncbi:hypothetical protein ACFY97_16870 [Streptomyces klenkii]|uniref:hypothetical protein n=1 Tax=Streptomyces klenkii TaxID=1420899 RepID=UPI0036F01703
MTKRHRPLTALGSGLPPEKRALAEGLRELHALLDPESPLTLQAVAELHSSHFGYGPSASTVSRYLSGRLPVPGDFVTKLHALAKRASGKDEGFKPLSHYLGLHQRAENSGRSSYKELRERIRELEGECTQARSEIASLRLSLSRPALMRGAGSHADRASIWAASGLAGHLPVPRDTGDRQRSAADVAAARQLAQRASELVAEDAHSALTLLQGTTEVLTPLESAASLVLLRQRHDHLADAFIRIYGHAQSDRTVMSVALELHEYGKPDEARAVLRAALN